MQTSRSTGGPNTSSFTESVLEMERVDRLACIDDTQERTMPDEMYQCTHTSTSFHHKNALGALYLALTGRGPSTGTSALLEDTPKRIAKTAFISDSKRERLDRAYAAIVARGEEVTGQALQREAHIGSNLIPTYIRERQGTPPKTSHQQRLDEAVETDPETLRGMMDDLNDLFG